MESSPIVAKLFFSFHGAGLSVSVGHSKTTLPPFIAVGRCVRVSRLAAAAFCACVFAFGASVFWQQQTVYVACRKRRIKQQQQKQQRANESVE